MFFDNIVIKKFFSKVSYDAYLVLSESIRFFG
jgi:hypothetical protein